jgi:xylose dehydrogenase (NAD/NADP)
MGAPVRWGILGTASVARSLFLPALRQEPGSVAWAVASRDGQRARAFAAAEGIARAYAGYERLLLDDAVDVVYVALPNHLHREWTIRALKAGKAVLCEKPLGLSLAEVTEMVAAAERAGRPLWEALVFAFQPQFARVRRELPGIGRLEAIDARFRVRTARPDDIRWRPEWGGGALYDLGCYPVHWACLLWDEEPTAVAAVRRLDAHGVDRETRAWVRFGPDKTLRFAVSLDGRPAMSLSMRGERGVLRLRHPYHQGPVETIRGSHGHSTTVIRLESRVASFQPALQHIAAVLRDGAPPLHTAKTDAVRTARVLEWVRSQALAWP